MAEHQVRIEPNGNLSFIYADDLANLAEVGKASTFRASHVEPDGDGQWTADMSPVGGPVLGPYRKRQDALDAEVAWLRDNHFRFEASDADD